MQFVDYELFSRGEMEVIIALPVEARVMNDGAANRAGHFSSVGVDTFEFALCGGQQVAVLIANMSLSNISVPVAVLLRLHGMPASIPAVKRSDDGYSPCTRR